MSVGLGSEGVGGEVGDEIDDGVDGRLRCAGGLRWCRMKRAIWSELGFGWMVR